MSMPKSNIEKIVDIMRKNKCNSLEKNNDELHAVMKKNTLRKIPKWIADRLGRK